MNRPASSKKVPLNGEFRVWRKEKRVRARGAEKSRKIRRSACLATARSVAITKEKPPFCGGRSRSQERQEAYSILGMLIGRFSNYPHRETRRGRPPLPLPPGLYSASLHIATINIPRARGRSSVIASSTEITTLVFRFEREKTKTLLITPSRLLARLRQRVVLLPGTASHFLRSNSTLEEFAERNDSPVPLKSDWRSTSTFFSRRNPSTIDRRVDLDSINNIYVFNIFVY